MDFEGLSLAEGGSDSCIVGVGLWGAGEFQELHVSPGPEPVRQDLF